MSVTTTVYTVYGVKVSEKLADKIYGLIKRHAKENDLDEYDLQDEFYNDFPVQDFMNGTYSIFGKVLFSYDPLAFDSDELVGIDVLDLPNYEKEVREKIEKEYPYLKEFIDKGTFKLYSTVVYT